MVQKTVIQYLDDLDGTERPDIETIDFSLDDKHYEIDLHADNAAALRAALAAYIEAGRKVTGKATASKGATGARTVARPSVDKEQNQAIRAWAKSHGWPISDRGRIPQEVQDAWHIGGTAANERIAVLVAERNANPAKQTAVASNGQPVQEPATVG